MLVLGGVHVNDAFFSTFGETCEDSAFAPTETELMRRMFTAREVVEYKDQSLYKDIDTELLTPTYSRFWDHRFVGDTIEYELRPEYVASTKATIIAQHRLYLLLRHCIDNCHDGTGTTSQSRDKKFLIARETYDKLSRVRLMFVDHTVNRSEAFRDDSYPLWFQPAKANDRLIAKQQNGFYAGSNLLAQLIVLCRDGFPIGIFKTLSQVMDQVSTLSPRRSPHEQWLEHCQILQQNRGLVAWGGRPLTIAGFQVDDEGEPLVLSKDVLAKSYIAYLHWLGKIFPQLREFAVTDEVTENILDLQSGAASELEKILELIRMKNIKCWDQSYVATQQDQILLENQTVFSLDTAAAAVASTHKATGAQGKKQAKGKKKNEKISDFRSGFNAVDRVIVNSFNKIDPSLFRVDTETGKDAVWKILVGIWRSENKTYFPDNLGSFFAFDEASNMPINPLKIVPFECEFKDRKFEANWFHFDVPKFGGNVNHMNFLGRVAALRFLLTGKCVHNGCKVRASAKLSEISKTIRSHPACSAAKEEYKPKDSGLPWDEEA